MLMRMVTYHVRVAYPFWFFHLQCGAFWATLITVAVKRPAMLLQMGKQWLIVTFRRKRTGVVQLYCVTNHERKYTTRLGTFQWWHAVKRGRKNRSTPEFGGGGGEIDGFHSILHHRNWRAKASCDVDINQSAVSMVV